MSEIKPTDINATFQRPKPDDQQERRVCARCHWEGYGKKGDSCPSCGASQCKCDVCEGKRIINER